MHPKWVTSTTKILMVTRASSVSRWCRIVGGPSLCRCSPELALPTFFSSAILGWTAYVESGGGASVLGSEGGPRQAPTWQVASRRRVSHREWRSSGRRTGCRFQMPAEVPGRWAIARRRLPGLGPAGRSDAEAGTAQQPVAEALRGEQGQYRRSHGGRPPGAAAHAEGVHVRRNAQRQRFSVISLAAGFWKLSPDAGRRQAAEGLGLTLILPQPGDRIFRA